MVTVQGDWRTPAADEACFEDGTLSFLQIPDLESGLSWINGIGMDLIHQRVTCLTGWFIDRLAALRHGNGEPMARIYGPANTRARGGTIAFNLLDRSDSSRQTGAERRGGRPARWTSTWTFSACRAAGRSAHPWAWPRTSTTSSDSSRSWS
jgi:selenocysteine lyase/cysteine desulfurase